MKFSLEIIEADREIFDFNFEEVIRRLAVVALYVTALILCIKSLFSL